MTRTRLTTTTVSFHSSSSSSFWSKVSVNYSTVYKNNQSVFVLVGAVDPVLSSTKGDNKTRLYVLQSHPFCFPFLSLSLFQPLFFSRKHRFRCNGRKHLTQFILFFFKMQLLLMRWNTRAPNTNTHTHTPTWKSTGTRLSSSTWLVFHTTKDSLPNLRCVYVFKKSCYNRTHTCTLSQDP